MMLESMVGQTTERGLEMNEHCTQGDGFAEAAPDVAEPTVSHTEGGVRGRTRPVFKGPPPRRGLLARSATSCRLESH